MEGTGRYVDPRPFDVDRVQPALGRIIAAQHGAIFRLTSLHFHAKCTCNDKTIKLQHLGLIISFGMTIYELLIFTCGERDHVSGHPALRPLYAPSAQMNY